MYRQNWYLKQHIQKSKVILNRHYGLKYITIIEKNRFSVTVGFLVKSYISENGKINTKNH